MYFDFNRKIDIDGLISEEYRIYAHRKNDRAETLGEHTALCTKYFSKIIEEKHLDEVFKKIEDKFFKDCSEDGKGIFREMIVNTVVLHDIGKVNPYFQKFNMKNDLKVDLDEGVKNKKHSMISSIVYIDHYYQEISRLVESEKNKYILLDFAFLNAYVISRHHTELNSLEDFKNEFSSGGFGKKLIESQRYLFEKTLDKKIALKKAESIKKMLKSVEVKVASGYSREEAINRYIYERLILSILVACDFYSTSEFMDGIETRDIGGMEDVDEFYGIYREGEIYRKIRNYEREEYGRKKDFSNVKDINTLRNEMFLDAESELEKNMDSDIFYLEAPTGSGKSNVATNLSFKLIEGDKNKIFYVYPFNTLVEQNINTLNEVFKKEKNILSKIAVINSVEPIKLDKELEKGEDANYEHYKKALLSRQFLNYPMILTTHVTMFRYFFGTEREDVFPFHQMSNSVIVFDEIQSYRNVIWGEIATFLSCYAKLLNIKVIIMSATLPNLNKLSLSEAGTVKLIENREKYFENPIFKNRVEVDFSLLDSEDEVTDLYNHLKNQIVKSIGDEKKFLIEFIRKESAYEFYRKLRNDEELDCEIELMSGDDNIAERERIIEKTKIKEMEKPLILVATQVIEAGVDIDMDIGYKNISLLDSEEQFLGRINRSCKKSRSKVYFFKLDDSKNIYKEDIRRNRDLTLENEDIRIILEEKNFSDFYDLVIDRLKDVTSEYNELNIESFFEGEVKKLDFKNIESRLRLINDNKDKISVYLSCDMEVKGEKLNGDKIWDAYRELLFDRKMDYSKRRVKLSELKSKMNNFIYEIRWNYDFSYNDRLGDLFFIEDGSSYFKDGKLDREKFTNNIGEFI